MLRETVGLAHSCGIRRISVGLEDVTRADQDFALAMARTAKDLGAARIRLADTLGVMTPLRIAELVRFFAGGVDMEIAIHCHNDFGMATANAVTALESGAHWADVSVLGIGDFRFGKPSRITARVRLGAGKVIDIEREVELGGPIHSKGVLILSGYLSATFLPEIPLH